MDTEKLIIPSGSSNDGLLGGGGIGALLIGALLFGGRGLGGLGGGWGGGIAAPATTAVATDIVLNPAFQSLQNQIQTLSGQVISEGNSRSFDQTQGLIASTGAAISSQLGGISTAVATGNFTTLQSLNGNLAALTAQNNQNALQTLNSFNNLTTTLLQGVNTLSIQTVNSTNQIIAQGTALSSQLATCCCDIQNKIASDGDETRALINSINLANIQGQLNDAKNQISNFQQTQTILNSLSPRPTVTAVV